MTPRAYTPRAELRDVTLRDGLQLTAKSLPTDRKVQIIRELLALGVPTLEIGSMARPDLVPPLADTLEVVAALEPEELERCWIWVATPRHVEKAAAAGARNFQYCFSASDSHNKANIGRTTEDSVAAMPDAVRISDEVGGCNPAVYRHRVHVPLRGADRSGACHRYRRRPTHRGSRRHRRMRHDRPGNTNAGQRSDTRPPGTNTAAPHRLPWARHLGTWRGQHARRDRRRRHAGGRITWRPWRLPIRPRRQRQHFYRGPVVRHSTGLVHALHAGVDGGDHRQAPRGTG